MTMGEVRVGVVGDLEDEGAIVVDGETNGTGADIAVFLSEGEYFALDDLCTHQRASLAEGWVEDREVECPLHSSRFSLRTGEALCPPATVAVRTHRVEVRGDEIWLLPGVPAEDAVLS